MGIDPFSKEGLHLASDWDFVPKIINYFGQAVQIRNLRKMIDR